MPYATALTCVLQNGRVEPISQNALRFYERIAYDDTFGGMVLDEDETDRICATPDIACYYERCCVIKSTCLQIKQQS